MNLQNLKDQFLDYTPDQKRALILGGCLAGLLSLFLLFLSRGESVEAQPVQVVQSETTPLSSKLLLVHVAGEVKVPGVYSLAQGARVADAIKAAGGVKKGRSTASVNLARFLEDGEQIYLSEAESSFTSAAGAHGGAQGKLNINRASVNELDGLPGVGPVLAARIAAYRQSNGKFASVDELRKVSGIGPAKFNDLRDFITV